MDSCTVLQSCLLSNFHNLVSVRLDVSNYVTWKFLTETFLQGCGLIRYIDGSFPCPPKHASKKENGIVSDIEKEYMNWVQTDSAVMSILAATLSSDALSVIIGSKTSKEIWCRLKEKYVDASRHNIMKFKSSMYNIRKGSDSIDKYLLRVKEICDQLAILEVSMDEEEIIESVLHGLPSEFAVIKAIIKIKTMNSSLSMAELRSLLLIAEDEIDQSVRSTFEKLKAAMLTHGYCLSKSDLASAPTHDTNANYDHGILHNGAFSYGFPPSYFMSTSSSYIAAPVSVSGYAQQPPPPQFFAAVCSQQNAKSIQAFDCNSHIEDLKLVCKANNEKYEARLNDANHEIHLLKSLVEELRTELQNAKASWEHKEFQLVNFVKRLEEEACAIKEEEALLKDSIKDIASEVVCLREALVEVKTENMKLRRRILNNENALRSTIHVNEELCIKEVVSHKNVEADLRRYKGGAGNKAIYASNHNNNDPDICVNIPVSATIIGNASRFADGNRINENDISSVLFFILCWICNYMKNYSSWRILYVLSRWFHSSTFVGHGLKECLVKYTLCCSLVLSTMFAVIWNVVAVIFQEKDIGFYSKADLSELLQNFWNVRVIKWPCFQSCNDLLLAFRQP